MGMHFETRFLARATTKLLEGGSLKGEKIVCLPNPRNPRGWGKNGVARDINRTTKSAISDFALKMEALNFLKALVHQLITIQCISIHPKL